MLTRYYLIDFFLLNQMIQDLSAFRPYLPTFAGRAVPMYQGRYMYVFRLCPLQLIFHFSERGFDKRASLLDVDNPVIYNKFSIRRRYL